MWWRQHPRRWEWSPLRRYCSTRRLGRWPWRASFTSACRMGVTRVNRSRVRWLTRSPKRSSMWRVVLPVPLPAAFCGPTPYTCRAFQLAVRRKPGRIARLSYVETGRGERIRTSDLLNPIQTRYQAAPRPDALQSSKLHSPMASMFGNQPQSANNRCGDVAGNIPGSAGGAPRAGGCARPPPPRSQDDLLQTLGNQPGFVKSRRRVCPLGPPQSLRQTVLGHLSSSDKPRAYKQSRRDCGGPRGGPASAADNAQTLGNQQPASPEAVVS